MPRPTCVACHDLPAALPLAVCSADRDDVQRALIDLADWYDGLLSRPVRSRLGIPGQRDPVERPAPMTDAAGSLRTEIRSTLLSWAKMHQEDAEVEPVAIVAVINELRAGTGSIIELTSYLEAAASWLLSHPAAAEYVHEIQRLAYRADRIGMGPKHRGVVIGRHSGGQGPRECGCVPGGCYGEHLDAEWVCDGLVWASSVNGEGECDGCGIRRPVGWWRQQWPAPVDDDALTYSEAATLIRETFRVERPIFERNVRDWLQRGRIEAARERASVTRGSVLRYAQSRWTPEFVV